MKESVMKLAYLWALSFVMQNMVQGLSPSLSMHPLDRALEGPYPCGAIRMVPGAHVAGGQVSEPNKYPWLASIICPDCQANATNKNPWGHICGGSLITQR